MYQGCRETKRTSQDKLPHRRRKPRQEGIERLYVCVRSANLLCQPIPIIHVHIISRETEAEDGEGR
jgi:hypothetical protein